MVDKFYESLCLITGGPQIKKEYVPHNTEPAFVLEMLKEGKDPKDKLIEHCKPNCHFWQEKLERCELKYEHMKAINPTKSCLYPMRDLVICIDACVNPMIFHHLQKGKGSHHVGH